MLSLFLVLLSSVSFAETKMMVPMSLSRIPVDTNPMALPTHTQYLDLEKKFMSGRTVEVEEVRGWYTGRCYFKDEPSRAVATLIAADSSAHSRTDGPAFSGSEYRHVTPLVDVNAVATKFDSANGLADVESVLKTARDLNGFPVRQNDEMVVQGHRTTDLESRVYRLRKSKGYLVLKLECAEHDYCSNFSGWISNKFLAYEGEPVAYCYYFRKVH